MTPDGNSPLPRPWIDAWGEALYGPHGFYRAAPGPAAHFLTATHGVLGEELAFALLAYADRYAGMPLRRVIDVGAGRGELATAFVAAAAALDRDLEVTGVDIVLRPDHLDARIGWLQSPGGGGLPDDLVGLTASLVIAHEWLDVVPCVVAEVDDAGNLREVLVTPDGAETLGEPVTGADLDWCTAYWPLLDPTPGDRVEIGRTRDLAWRDLLARIDSGMAIAVDYGHVAGARPLTGTLTAYRDGRETDPVPDGSCDLTAHVAMDSLSGHAVVSQREALLGAGLSVALPDPALARTAPTAYLDALTRANARAQLVNRGSFGGFLWSITHVGADAAPETSLALADSPP